MRTTDYIVHGPLTQKVLNPLVMRLGLATTLAVRGRASGRIRTVPVNVLSLRGERYLVSARGQAQWVRNLRAAGQGELRRRGNVEHFAAEEVPGGEVGAKSDIIAAYRKRWDSQVKRFFEALPDPADHPIFRILPPGVA